MIKTGWIAAGLAAGFVAGLTASSSGAPKFEWELNKCYDDAALNEAPPWGDVEINVKVAYIGDRPHRPIMAITSLRDGSTIYFVARGPMDDWASPFSIMCYAGTVEPALEPVYFLR